MVSASRRSSTWRTLSVLIVGAVVVSTTAGCTRAARERAAAERAAAGLVPQTVMEASLPPVNGVTPADAERARLASLPTPATAEVAIARPGTPTTQTADARGGVDARTPGVVEASAPGETTGSIRRAEPAQAEPQPVRVPIGGRTPIGPQVETRNIGEDMPLNAVVAAALAAHPEIGMATARATEARAGIALARAALFPVIESRFTLGQGTPITPESDVGTLVPGASITSQRAATLSFRQLIYDFGQARNDILRSRAMHESENLRVIDRMEDVALRTTIAYLRILEQREVVALADENVAAHVRLGRLVEESQRAGNATVADVSRVQSRLVEAQAQRADLASDLQQATDLFRRLTRLDPGQLSRPRLPTSTIPRSVEQALAEIDERHPRLLSVAAQRRSQTNELQAMRATNMPRLGFELEATQRTMLEPVNRTENDLRGMFVVRHRFADGGVRRAQADQIRARMNGTDATYANERDEIESNMRQSFRAITTARSKFETLQSGERSSRQVRELYLEQFRGGKRTIFEVLDSHQALYQARRALVQNRFEELRASYGLLRTVGRVAETIMQGGSHAPEPAPARVSARPNGR